MSDEARTLAARGDLIELIAHYSHLLNGGEFDRLQTLFSEDARFLTPGRDTVMPVPAAGAAAIRAAVEQRYATVGVGVQLRHVITATVIDELGERTASARSLLVLVATPRNGAGELRGTGVYHDRFVREDAGWRFGERVLGLDGRRHEASLGGGGVGRGGVTLHARAGVTMLAAVDEELRRAIVRGEIRDLLARFAHCLDAGEFDQLETMFAENATFAVEPDPGIVPASIDGSSAIRAAFEARRAGYTDQAQRRHIVSTIVVDEISPDRAHARSFLTIISTPSEGGAIELRGSGVYDDVFARSEQGWRFAERRLTLDGFNAGPG